MAFPIDADRVTTAVGNTVNGEPINLPPNIQSGNLLVIAWCRWSSTADKTVTGFTRLEELTSFGGSSHHATIWYRFADGTEGASTPTSYPGEGKMTAVCWRITGASTTIAPQFVTGSTDADTPDPGLIAPSGAPKDFLFIWAGECDTQPTMPPSGSPTSYSNAVGAQSGGTGAATSKNCTFGATRQLTTSIEDPGSWTLDVGTATSVAWAIAVHPLAGIPTPNLFTRTNARW